MLVALALSVATSAVAETPRIIDVRIDAAPSEDVDQLAKLSGLTIGLPYRPLEVRKAVRRLYQLGRFENVFVRAARVRQGYRISVQLPPRQVIRAVEIESDALDDSEVLEAMQAQVGDRFDRRVVPDWTEALKTTLIREGYRTPQIKISHRMANEDGGVDVRVQVQEGPVTRLAQVILQGRLRRPVRQIEDRITIDSGDVLDLGNVDETIEAIKVYYSDAGFLDARVRLVEVRPRPSTPQRADVVLRIDAGSSVTIRFKGNRAVGTRALKEDAEVLKELGTGPAALAEVREQIVSRYERRGYWRVQVVPSARVTRDRDKKEVLFSIQENRPAFVRRLRFPGNQLFSDDELTDTVVQLVRDALGDADRQPGADPAVVDAIVGRVSGRGSSRAPDTSAPDPEQVYIPRAFRAAQAELADLYRAKGYQTVEVSNPIIETVPDQDVVDVAIPIRQGVRWRIGAVSFSGNERVTSIELLERAKVEFDRENGQPLAFGDIDDARRAILKHYRDLGYLYVQVTEAVLPLTDRGAAPSVARLTETSTRATGTTGSEVRRVCARAEAAGKANCDVELTFSIVEGPRVKTRDIIVKGAQTTWDSIIENEIELTPDEILSANDIEQTRDNLLRLGLFDLVDVRPLDGDVVGDLKDVLVEVKERDHYWLELGVGASTEDGLRGSAAFGDGNLFGSALRLQMQAGINVWLPSLLVLYDEAIRDSIADFYGRFGTLGRLEYEVAAGLLYPRIPGLPRGFSAGLDLIVLRDFDPAFLENTQTLTLLANYKDPSASLELPRRPSFQIRGNLERTALECNTIFARNLQGSGAPIVDLLRDFALLCSTDFVDSDDPNTTFRGTTFYLSAGPRVTWDLRDDPLNPKKGAYFEIESFYGVGLDDESPDYVNVNGRANFYLPLHPRLVFAMSILAAKLIQVGNGNRQIPLNRRLFAGGRTTIRGYAEKTLLPQDTELDPDTGLPVSDISTGGRLMAALKSELRVLLFPSLALSIFYDIGDLWEDGEFRSQTVTTFTSDGTIVGDDPDLVIRRALAQGAGVGLRIATPIGPLAIDLAVPVNRRDPGSSNIQLHFAVGSF